MSYTFNTTKAQRRMVRRWCVDNGVRSNNHRWWGHDASIMAAWVKVTHNGMQYFAEPFFDYKWVHNDPVVYLCWCGESLEDTSDAVAFLRMTVPTKCAICIVVETPQPTQPSRVKHEQDQTTESE